MKKILLYTFLLLWIDVSQAQPSSINYYYSIKKYDLSKLWRGNKLKMDGGGEIVTDFPEPLGYIGNDYHRFYIHYSVVTKDSSNLYRYFVQGKTRVNNNICSFTGTITINKAILYKKSNNPKYQAGKIICNVDFREDSTQTGSGHIKGTLITNWYLDKQGRIFYDTIDSNSDGWNNNQCKAKWTSYTSQKTKICNWGDWRIPDSGDLDIGAGEFGVNSKYINNGWLTYSKMDGGDATAKREENRKWWLK